ncbi:MAG: penicillin-binding protein 1C [Desulfuromonas sp.]|nr:MAG: penicillin-binding protein 1C [Desulfuromonas sp.]
MLIVVVLLLGRAGDYLWQDRTFLSSQRPSTQIVDRYGSLMRFLPNARGERQLLLPEGEIPPVIEACFLAAEDKNFYLHPGFDALAIVRALKTNVAAGKVVSGASTITQQLASMIVPSRRSYWGKVGEVFHAFLLETQFSKKAILRAYLDHVPMGNNLVGVEAAARIYFKKGAAALSPAEASILASIPKSPNRLNPATGDRARLRQRAEAILAHSPYAKNTVDLEALLLEAHKGDLFPFAAPHFTERLIRHGLPSMEIVKTTLDLDLQQGVEKVLASHKERLATLGATQAAALVVHNRSHDILAWSGSLAYGEENLGFNDGVTARRSPGSTLKPFAYALALERGMPTSRVVQDVLQKFKTVTGEYEPTNYDEKELGPVPLRTALGNSLNIAAVRVLQSLGIEPFFSFLKRLGLVGHDQRSADSYGLGMVIGNVEIDLLSLVEAYTIFPSEGRRKPLRLLAADTPSLDAGDDVISAGTAYIISDILADPAARTLAFERPIGRQIPFPIAFKTGTSSKFRDGWIVGFNADYTVGVWAGNFDGRSTDSLNGSQGPGPIFEDVFALLHSAGGPNARPQEVIEVEVCSLSGMRPGANCKEIRRELFTQKNMPHPRCTYHAGEGGHTLPAEYAGWLTEREERGGGGNYRLSNAIAGRISAGGGSQHAGELLVIGDPDHPPGQNQGCAAGVKILYPLRGDHFLAGNAGTVRVKLEAGVSEVYDHVDWFLDGVLLGRVSRPYRLDVNLGPGRHTLAAYSPDHCGDRIAVLVE